MMMSSPKWTDTKVSIDMRKTVFVVIEVTYDYYRFERFLKVFESESDAIDFSRTLNYPIKEYRSNDETESKLDDSEQAHIWVNKTELK